MERYEAIGCIETFGLVFVLEAADAMCKAADVELIGYENVASGYISVIVQGDVGACRTAVDAGVKAVENMGAEEMCIRDRSRGAPGLGAVYSV